MHAHEQHEQASRPQVGTLVASLAWVHMLLRKSATRVMQLSTLIWPALFKCLSFPAEEVVRLDIEALAYMASSTQQHFVRVQWQFDANFTLVPALCLLCACFVPALCLLAPCNQCSQPCNLMVTAGAIH